MKPEHISPIKARQIAVHAQLLNRRAEGPNCKKDPADLIDHLGYIQIDTISVIKRSHHHTLWTRCTEYRENTLHDLQAKDRKIYEYWAHAMAYLPISDFRYSLPRMKNFENPKSPWARYQMEKCKSILPDIFNRVRKEGPLSSRDFSHDSGEKGSTWWDWKPAKVALEMLFWQGKLMITERSNFQKVYDLTERVLPEEIDLSMPDKEEIGYFLVRRALKAFGVAAERDIRSFMQPNEGRDADMQLADKETVSEAVQNLTESGEVIPVRVGKDKTSLYALTAVFRNGNKLKSINDSVHLLSPFDNLIIQRERVKRLFGFDYALECYLPESKRKYGYFVLPVLWDDRFAARLDAKADRKNKTMMIRNLVYEPDLIDPDQLLPQLAQKLSQFTRFNNCESVNIEKCSDKKTRPVLMRMIKQSMQN